MTQTFPTAAFWTCFESRHPRERDRRTAKSGFWWHRGLPEHDLVITLFLSPDDGYVGIFLGRNVREGAVNILERLAPRKADIVEALSLRPEQQSDEFPFVSTWTVDCRNEENWPAMSDWLVTEASRYESALKSILGPG